MASDSSKYRAILLVRGAVDEFPDALICFEGRWYGLNRFVCIALVFWRLRESDLDSMSRSIIRSIELTYCSKLFL